jgi:hypothetical protein
MSTAATTPDLPPPSRSSRLLTLVRKLVDYGKLLADSLRQRAIPNDTTGLFRSFGTSDIALILARIAQGLTRARFLEEKITRVADRLDANPQPTPTPRPLRTPRASPSEAEAPSPAPTANTDLCLPTADEIAAKIRRQPIGAVLADICRDLGIVRGHPLWDELHLAITIYGGDPRPLFMQWLNRSFPIAHILARLRAKPDAPPARASTGPPLLDPQPA